MTDLRRLLRYLLILALWPSGALAIVPPEYEDPEEPWTAGIEFGWMYDKGNKTSRSLNTTLEIEYEIKDKYKGYFEYNFDFASDDDVETTKKDRFQLQGDYNFNDENYVFARADIKSDEFGSFAEEKTYSTGYGHIFLDEKKHKLNLEIGPGFRQSKPQQGNFDDPAVDEAIIRSVVKYQRFFTEHLKFYADSSLEIGDKNSISVTNLKLEQKLFGDLFLVFDLQYTYRDKVPTDTVRNEFVNKFNLKYLL